MAQSCAKVIYGALLVGKALSNVGGTVFNFKNIHDYYARIPKPELNYSAFSSPYVLPPLALCTIAALVCAYNTRGYTLYDWLVNKKSNEVPAQPAVEEDDDNPPLIPSRCRKITAGIIVVAPVVLGVVTIVFVSLNSYFGGINIIDLVATCANTEFTSIWAQIGRHTFSGYITLANAITFISFNFQDIIVNSRKLGNDILVGNTLERNRAMKTIGIALLNSISSVGLAYNSTYKAMTRLFSGQLDESTNSLISALSTISAFSSDTFTGLISTYKALGKDKAVEVDELEDQWTWFIRITRFMGGLDTAQTSLSKKVSLCLFLAKFTPLALFAPETIVLSALCAASALAVNYLFSVHDASEKAIKIEHRNTLLTVKSDSNLKSKGKKKKPEDIALNRLPDAANRTNGYTPLPANEAPASPIPEVKVEIKTPAKLSLANFSLYKKVDKKEFANGQPLLEGRRASL